MDLDGSCIRPVFEAYTPGSVSMVLVEEGDCDRHSCSSDEERNRPGKGLACHVPHILQGPPCILDDTFSKTTMSATASKTEGIRNRSHFPQRRMQAGLELRTTTQQYTWMRWKETGWGGLRQSSCRWLLCLLIVAGPGLLV